MKYRLRGLFGLLCIVSVLGSVPMVSSALDFSAVPGTVLDYIELDYSWGHSAPDKFIADPEILVLPNGYYLAAHSWAGWDSGSGTSGQTKVFRSTNSGVSWSHVSTLNGILRGSLFATNGYVYLVGSSHDELYSDTMMARSSDNGSSWSLANFGSLDGTGVGPGTPCNPVVWGGRWWTCLSTYHVITAPTTSDLYSVGSWTKVTGFPGSSTWDWATSSITEPQIMSSPNLGVFMMQQVSQEKISPVSRVSVIGSTLSVKFDPINGFASLPCGEKKFGATYDPVSEKFWILGNPNLPADEAAASDINVDMIRNTTAMLSSKDLLHWDVEQVFVYSTDERREGTCYCNFDIDGDDLVVAARTASADIPGETDPNDGRGGHDSNCFTYHRVEDFRTAVADHVAAISGGDVILYERTPDQNDNSMIMRSFALGPYAPLMSAVTALGVANGGRDIYTQRTTGTIFHWDAFGNFIDVVSPAPVPMSYSGVLSRPPEDECCWTKSGSGDWEDATNWHYWTRADTDDEIAVFGSAILSNSTINLDSPQQWWNFSTTGDLEGWTVGRATASVSGGTLSGTSTSTSAPYLKREDCLFYGADSQLVALRMRASENCDVYLYWGTSLNPAFEGYTTKQYTGNGAWQQITFNMKTIPSWDEKLIAMMRIDPRVSINNTFEIDWIADGRSAARVKGLRFLHNTYSYTIDGSGMLAIEADSGNGSIDVIMGSHTIDTHVLFKSDTDVTLDSGTSLELSGGLTLNGTELNVGGEGEFIVGGQIMLGNGTFVTDGEVPITFDSVSSDSDFSGTLKFDPPEPFNPVEWNYFQVIEDPSELNGKTFSSLDLPELSGDLYWQTTYLYTDGFVRVRSH